MAWEGKAEDEILTHEEVHRFATDEFSTELCNVPEITERQKVAPPVLPVHCTTCANLSVQCCVTMHTTVLVNKSIGSNSAEVRL